MARCLEWGGREFEMLVWRLMMMWDAAILCLFHFSMCYGRCRSSFSFSLFFFPSFPLSFLLSVFIFFYFLLFF